MGYSSYANFGIFPFYSYNAYWALHIDLSESLTIWLWNEFDSKNRWQFLNNIGEKILSYKDVVQLKHFHYHIWNGYLSFLKLI